MTKIFSLWFAVTLALPLRGWAQDANAQKPPNPEPSGNLKIVVIQGDGAVNHIKTRSAVQPVVEVRDQNDKPLPGVDVSFQLPANGPSGVFNGWLQYQTARTDARGQAAATGLTPNDQEGRFYIKVSAFAKGQSAAATIAQTNSQSTANTLRRSHAKLYTVLGLVVVGAIAGGVAASHSGGSSVPAVVTNPVTIGAGPITVGGPH